MLKQFLKNKFVRAIALAAAVSLPVSAITAKRSEALVALAARSTAVGVVSGLSILGGGGVAGASAVYLAVNTAGGLAVALSAVTVGSVVFFGGAILAGIGIILLDDSQNVSLAFNPLNPETDAARLGVSAQAIEIYNQELHELNAVRETVEQEFTVSSRRSLEQSKQLWEAYSADLRPETVEVAKQIAKGFVDTVHRSL